MSGYRWRLPSRRWDGGTTALCGAITAAVWMLAAAAGCTFAAEGLPASDPGAPGAPGPDAAPEAPPMEEPMEEPDVGEPSVPAPTVQCGQLSFILRDFKDDHPDMERGGGGSLKGLVEAELGADDKPVYAPSGATEVTEGEEFFDQWYRDVDGVNRRFEELVQLEEIEPGRFQFRNPEYFPLDGRGFPGQEREGHNFHFTTEIIAGFAYQGGETINLRGDDDIFVFINRRLMIDLGGLHQPQRQTVELDQANAELLNLTPGQVYPIHIFHAERQTTGSHFEFDTTIACLGQVE